MTLGDHISALRKKKKMSQGDLGGIVGTSGDLIGRYERNEVKPSIEVVVKIADTLNVSIDFLVGKAEQELDEEALKRIKDISQLPEENRQQVYMVIDALVRDYKTRQAYL